MTDPQAHLLGALGGSILLRHVLEARAFLQSGVSPPQPTNVLWDALATS